MRTAAIGATILLAFSACSTTNQNTTDSPFVQPNQLMATEITRRIEQVPYLHREELLENLLWLAQNGEQVIPSLLVALRHDSPKVRSSAAWVLGRMRDRRTMTELQAAMTDRDPTVKMECARTLVLLGDLVHSPVLIEGLDSDRKEVRYLCHEALKTSTGHDFGYDHLAMSDELLRVAVLRWRQWWSEYSGDQMFAAKYQQKYGITAQPAVPTGETKTPAAVPSGTGNTGTGNVSPNAMPVQTGNQVPTGAQIPIVDVDNTIDISTPVDNQPILLKPSAGKASVGAPNNPGQNSTPQTGVDAASPGAGGQSTKTQGKPATPVVMPVVVPKSNGGN